MTCRFSNHSGTYSGWLKLLWALSIKRFLGILSDLQESLRDLGGRQDRLSTGSVPLSSGKCMYVISSAWKLDHTVCQSNWDVYSWHACSSLKFILKCMVFVVFDKWKKGTLSSLQWCWCDYLVGQGDLVITICHQDLPAMGDYGAVCD